MQEPQPSLPLAPPDSFNSRPAVQHRFFFFLRRYWWVPTVCVVLAAVGWGVSLNFKTAAYSSVATLGSQDRLALPGGGLFREDNYNINFGTPIHQLRSPYLIERAHERTLEARPGSQRSFVRVLVNQQRNAPVLVIQAIGPDPGYLPVFLDALVDEYFALKRSIRKKVTDSAEGTVSQKLGTLESNRRSAQDKLLEFERTYSLVTMQQDSGRLITLNTRLADLGSEEGLLNRYTTNPAALTNGLGPSTSVFNATATEAESASIAAQLRQAREQREALSKTYKPKHPKIVKIDEEIQRLERRDEIYREQMLQRISRRLAELADQKRSLEGELEQCRARVADNESRELTHQRLKKELDDANKAYEDRQRFLDQVQFSRDMETEPLSQLERASPPLLIETSLVESALPFAGLGLGLGFGLIYLLSRFNKRINVAVDLSYSFQEPVLGQIPEIKMVRNSSDTAMLRKDDARFAFAESFRSLYSALHFLQADQALPRTIIVTSAIAGEGKSMIAVNLAQTLAWSGKRVLLVDADLRRGHVHRYFRVHAHPGLGEVLALAAPLEKVVISTATPGLSFMPVGGARGNPGESFLSGQIAQLLARLEPDYDHVVLDTPPVLAAADVSSLAPKVGGVVFVVRSSHTSITEIRYALDHLRQRRAQILGIVLNRARASSRDYGFYRYKEYYQRTEDEAGPDSSLPKASLLTQAEIIKKDGGHR